MLDTNVLVYAVSHGNADQAKRRVALELLNKTKFGVSAQVLQEFFVTTTRKIKSPLSFDEALDWVETLEECPCVSLDASLVRYGAELSFRYQISYWDGAILAAAHRLGAELLYSEDLSDGQTYGTVRVANPFKNLN